LLRLTSMLVVISTGIACASADADGESDPLSAVSLMSDVTCSGPAQSEELVALEQDVVALANWHRLSGASCAGEVLPPAPELLIEPSLVCVARAHSRDMAERAYFGHTAPDGASPFERLTRAEYDFRAAAENIAMGQLNAERVVASWMESDGHCQNIMA